MLDYMGNIPSKENKGFLCELFMRSYSVKLFYVVRVWVAKRRFQEFAASQPPPMPRNESEYAKKGGLAGRIEICKQYAI